jgi:hypothetical protein
MEAPTTPSAQALVAEAKAASERILTELRGEERVRAAAVLAAEHKGLLARAVEAYRAEDHGSWAGVGRVLGVTPQAAWGRFKDIWPGPTRSLPDDDQRK